MNVFIQFCKNYMNQSNAEKTCSVSVPLDPFNFIPFPHCVFLFFFLSLSPSHHLFVSFSTSLFSLSFSLPLCTMAFLSELNCGTLTFQIPLVIVVHKHVKCQDNSKRLLSFWFLFCFVFFRKNKVLRAFEWEPFLKYEPNAPYYICVVFCQIIGLCGKMTKYCNSL